MTKAIKILLEILYCLGLMLGTYFLADFILEKAFQLSAGTIWLSAIIISVAFIGIMSFLTASPVIEALMAALGRIINRVAKMAAKDLLGATLGLILGLMIAALLSSSISGLKYGSYIGFFFSVLMGYIGIMVGLRINDEVLLLLNRKGPPKEKPAKAETKGDARPKLLDTSVIIDGRIADIYKTGFIEGPLVVPGFILDELKHVADSSDLLKKNRGRRGLDILNKMRKDFADRVMVVEKDYDDIREVDVKLIRMAMDLDGAVLTNDFNLNKMAQVQNVTVLNINELSNAIKTVVLPGEEMVVRIIKEGKESDQGVAYLEDGTMIVVEGGRRYEGTTLTVVVTSVLQTAAGRMIFAKPK